MDVRQKQRLFYHVAFFLSACVQPVSPHVISTVVPLSFAMRRKYKSTWWSVELPNAWKAESDEECVTFTSEQGVGALQISAYRRDGENVTNQNLLEFAEDDLAEVETPQIVSYNEFVGFEISCFSGENFWRKLWLRSNSLLLFITFNCAAEERAVETEDIDQILKSLSVK